MGLTVDELRVLPLEDFMSLVEMFVADDTGASSEARGATQADINAILG